MNKKKAPNQAVQAKIDAEKNRIRAEAARFAEKHAAFGRASSHMSLLSRGGDLPPRGSYDSVSPPVKIRIDD